MTIKNNFAVWGAVSELASAYKKMNSENELVDDIESQELVRKAIAAKYDFFYRNGLLLVNPFSEEGELIDRVYRRKDFSDEGFELCRKKVPAWMRSKASKKNPPDISALEKALKDMRGA